MQFITFCDEIDWEQQNTNEHKQISWAKFLEMISICAPRVLCAFATICVFILHLESIIFHIFLLSHVDHDKKFLKRKVLVKRSWKKEMGWWILMRVINRFNSLQIKSKYTFQDSIRLIMAPTTTSTAVIKLIRKEKRKKFFLSYIKPCFCPSLLLPLINNLNLRFCSPQTPTHDFQAVIMIPKKKPKQFFLKINWRSRSTWSVFLRFYFFSGFFSGDWIN